MPVCVLPVVVVPLCGVRFACRRDRDSYRVDEVDDARRVCWGCLYMYVHPGRCSPTYFWLSCGTQTEDSILHRPGAAAVVKANGAGYMLKSRWCAHALLGSGCYNMVSWEVALFSLGMAWACPDDCRVDLREGGEWSTWHLRVRSAIHSAS